ncbi:MAG: hypothetical protein MJA84_11095 [Firmicutes bacterium]|nr:hypothetical protein [Bacillota bacterium]
MTVTGGIATATGGAIGGLRKLDEEVIEQRAARNGGNKEKLNLKRQNPALNR